MLFIGVATHFAFVLCGLAGILLHASRLKSHFNIIPIYTESRLQWERH
jgi:hypothetical protein